MCLIESQIIQPCSVLVKQFLQAGRHQVTWNSHFWTLQGLVIAEQHEYRAAGFACRRSNLAIDHDHLLLLGVSLSKYTPNDLYQTSNL